MSNHKISICLSDIPKDKIITAANGKKYLNIVTSEKKEKDQYGKDCTCYIEQTKEERESKQAKIYIGSGWVQNFEKQPEAPKSETTSQDPIKWQGGDSETDDLPFNLGSR